MFIEGFANVRVERTHSSTLPVMSSRDRTSSEQQCFVARAQGAVRGFDMQDIL
jgi:hypothetical protein